MTKNKHYSVIMVGACITAISAIRTLINEDFKGSILLINGEDRLPYKRTKINKHIVKGFDKNEFQLGSEQWYKNHNTKIINDYATEIDSNIKQVKTLKHGLFTFDKLLISTGKSSIYPSIIGVDNKEYLKVQNANDVDQLISTLPSQKKYLIIGAGVEGLETADQLIRKGKDVYLLDRNTRPLHRQFPEAYTDLVKEAMVKKGITYFTGQSTQTIRKTEDGKYQAIINGDTYFFDKLIACTGAIPNTQLAKTAHLKTDRGIIVDKFLQTSCPNIYAAGDVAQHKNGIITGLWHAAEYQGKVAALNMIGKTQKLDLRPFRLKVEIFGLFLFSGGYDQAITSQMEKITEKRNSVERTFFFLQDKIKAIIMVNDGDRAKIYQKALIEGWSKETISKELPINPPAIFHLKPSF